MPTITIPIPKEEYNKIKTRARREGFKNPADWARFLVEKNVQLEESPRLSPSKIILEMKKIGVHKPLFLLGLKKSLEYADKIA